MNRYLGLWRICVPEAVTEAYLGLLEPSLGISLALAPFPTTRTIQAEEKKKGLLLVTRAIIHVFPAQIGPLELRSAPLQNPPRTSRARRPSRLHHTTP